MLKTDAVLEVLRGDPAIPLDKRLDLAGVTQEEFEAAMSDRGLQAEILSTCTSNVLAEIPAIMDTLTKRAKSGNTDALKGVLLMLGEKSPLNADVDSDVMSLSDKGLRMAAENNFRQLAMYLGYDEARRLLKELEDGYEEDGNRTGSRGGAVDLLMRDGAEDG